MSDLWLSAHFFLSTVEQLRVSLLATAQCIKTFL